MKAKRTVLGALIGMALLGAAASAVSPYAGHTGRSIKALSSEEIDSLLNGKGMGFAKAAELNHYPGPRHVLELAEPLALSDVQRKQSQAIFDRMSAQAVVLGRELVDAERALDARFAEANLSEAELDRLVGDIARLNGKLRAVHLAAHLAERQVLTAEQIRRYDTLRGYADSDHTTHSAH